jgi:hypothetical protein
VVIGGAWFGLVGPKRAESRDVAAQIDAARSELATATEQTRAAEAAQDNFGEDTAAVATLGKAVPDDDQTASLLYQLDAAAGDSRVELTSITPSVGAAEGAATAVNPALPAGVTEVSLSLSFSGRFADLQRFLRRAHGSTSVRGDDVRVRGRLLSIRDVQLTPVAGGRVTATVQAAAYMAAPEAASAAPAGEQPPAPDESTAATAPPTQPAMIGAGG